MGERLLRYPVFVKSPKSQKERFGKTTPVRASWQVYIPGFHTYTEGSSEIHAGHAAAKIIEFEVSCLEEKGAVVPKPLTPEEALRDAADDAPWFECSDAELVYITVDLGSRDVNRLEKALLTFIEREAAEKTGPHTECAMAIPQAARALIKLWDIENRI